MNVGIKPAELAPFCERHPLSIATDIVVLNLPAFSDQALIFACLPSHGRVRKGRLKTRKLLEELEHFFGEPVRQRGAINGEQIPSSNIEAYGRLLLRHG